MATVKLFGNLRNYIDRSTLQIPGANIQLVLDQLCDHHPPLCDVVFEKGNLKPHFKIMINGHDITLANGLDTPVSEDDQIAIFPPIAGG
jgi:molybdopterin synthase sulfur carrier subunit